MKPGKQNMWVRQNEFDDVYVECDEKVYLPDFPPARAPRHRYATRWLASAFVVVLLASSTGLTYGNITGTGSYFRDTELSSVNRLVAGILDFIGIESPQAYDIYEDNPPVDVPIVITPEPGSVDMHYHTTVEYVSGSATLCNALMASVASPFAFSGGLLLLDGYAFVVPSLTIGTTLTDSAGLTDGDQCEVDIVFRSWNKDVPENTGYVDEERVNVTFTFREPLDNGGGGNNVPSDFDVVLNEFLPDPDDEAGGLNFGDDSDSKPLGEWVELYNNGAAPVDVLDWYLKDASGGAGNTHAVIGPTNTNTGSTIIAPGGWLVVYMNKSTLNNTGDTIRLFSDEDILIDSVTYNDPPPACFNDPTPGDENSTTTPTGTPGNGNQADCNQAQVPPNKSYARIPDGTGVWVDPIPTPGAPNILEETPVEEPLPEEVVEEVIEEVVEEPPAEEVAEEPHEEVPEELEPKPEPGPEPSEPKTLEPATEDAPLAEELIGV